jgi:AcrR family transcriptional regulator
MLKTMAKQRAGSGTDAPPKLDRRRQILEVATELFARHGVQSVTTRQIAAAVGISQPSLYAHFGSIQDIHDEVSRHAFALLEASGQSAIEQQHGPQELLHKAIASYFEFGLGNPSAYRIAFMLEQGEDEHYEAAEVSEEFKRLDHPGPRAYAHLQKVVSLVRPDLMAQDVDSLAQSLWAMLHGLVSLLIARGSFPWIGRERLVRQHGELAYQMVVDFRP